MKVTYDKADCCFSVSSETGDPLVGSAHSEARAKKTEKARKIRKILSELS